MIIGFIIDLAVGTACIITGLIIWIKQNVSIIHQYHYKNVSKEDFPSYTRLIGAGIIIIGTGIVITGILNLFYSSLWWIPLLTGFIAGIVVLYAAQKKYNGSVF